MRNINRTWLIETIVPGVSGGNTAQRIQFQDQPYLRFMTIQSLELYLYGDGIIKGPSGTQNFSQAEIGSGFLTLYLNDPNNQNSQGEWVQNIPLLDLHYLQNQAGDTFARIPFEFEKGITVLWEKSYMTFGAALGNTANRSVLLNVYFTALMAIQ